MPTNPKLLAELKRSKDPDAMVLLQMVENGANLAKPHEPDFAFEMPSLETAKKIEAELYSEGYLVELFDPDMDNPTYQVIARRTMVLDLHALNQLSIQFEALAKRFGGIYDGWGAEIVE